MQFIPLIMRLEINMKRFFRIITVICSIAIVMTIGGVFPASGAEECSGILTIAPGKTVPGGTCVMGLSLTGTDIEFKEFTFNLDMEQPGRLASASGCDMGVSDNYSSIHFTRIYPGSKSTLYITVPGDLKQGDKFPLKITKAFGYATDGTKYSLTPKDSYIEITAKSSSYELQYESYSNDTVKVVGCTGYPESIVIPETYNGAKVSYVYRHAFEYHSQLKSVTLPDTVNLIGEYAFYCCSQLSEINFPSSLTGIEQCAFSKSGLTKAVFSYGINKIGASAFNRCQDLSYIYLPKSITFIGSGAFFDCNSLEKVVAKCDPEIESQALPLKGWLNKNLTIYGRPGSSFERIANEKGFDFKPLYTTSLDVVHNAFEDRQSLIKTLMKVTYYTGEEIYDYDYTVKDNVASVSVDGTVYHSITFVKRGDVNGDGKITAEDASLAFSEYKRIYKGQPQKLSDSEIYAANVDSDTQQDNKLTAKDASYIFSYYKEEYKNGTASFPFLKE